VPARLLERPPTGGAVAAQQPIFVLEAPEQGYRARVAASSVETLDRQLRGLRGLDDGEEQRARLEGRRAMHRAEMQAQKEETERLVLTAPFSGRLTDLDPDLAPGVWVGTRDELAVLVAPEHWQAEVFVDQDELPRLAIGATARFYPEGRRLFPLTGVVVDIERTRTGTLPLDLLSSEHGGSIPVLPGQQRQPTPRDALYRVRVDLAEAPTELKVLRGEGVMQGRPESWLGNLLKPLVIVLIRELSF
jgi:putative peptide zinc metalloprotease protein